MKLRALTSIVFLATISYSFGTKDTNSTSVMTNKPFKPPGDTGVNSTKQNGNHTNSPTKKITEPLTEAASKQTTKKSEQKPTKDPLNPRKNSTGTTKPRTTKPTTAKPRTTKPRTTKPTEPHKKINTSKNPITTPKPTTTPKPKIPCEMRNESCKACLKDSSCFYCDSVNTCNKMTSKIIPTGCKGNKWYWKQCKILGNILIIVIPTVGGVLLIMLGCCIYCCCCRRCSKNRVAREERRQQQRRADRQERNAERKQTRKARHDAIRMKYGLLQNMDDDEDDDPVA